MSATAEVTEPTGLIGRPMPRRQDARLLRGAGHYVDDVDAPAACYAAVIRSPVAHGHITRFDGAAAMTHGAVLVLGPQEIARLTEPLQTTWRLPGQALDRIELALETVRYAGQPIGLVVAADRASAEDAAEHIDLRIDPLPAAVGLEQALAEDAPLLYPAAGTNIAGQFHFGDPEEDLEQVFATAPHVVERRLGIQRVSAAPMEPRGILAEWTSSIEQLTVWSSTQSPHVVRQELANALRLRVDQIRVIAPDVGGSFGSKTILYPDEAMVCLAAVLLGGQVKWIEDRAENLSSSYHGRGQVADARLAIDAQGKFLALHTRITGDLGAFPTQAGSGPFQVTALAMEGPYRFERAGATVTGVYTNAVPTASYRGYGMQEASWIRERLIEEAARELGLDATTLRLDNMIGPGEFPYTTHTGLTYDGGDYPAALRRAAELAAAQLRPSSPDRRRGTAVTASVEITGFAPSALLEAFFIDWSGWEGCRLRVNQDGTVTVFSGVIAVGQGIETTLAQVAADYLGVPIDWVSIQLGDTAVTPYSDLSSQASRSLTLAGGALVQAATRMRERMQALAAHHLGVTTEEVIFDLAPDASLTPDKAMYQVAGQTAALSWREVARRGWKGWGPAEPGRIQLEESVDFDPPAITFSYSSHAANVAVDPQTGQVTVEGYWSVNDSGVLVNPMIADGQIAGGIVQGLGIALLEEIRYDPDTGQPLTTGYADYALPTMADVPPLAIEHMCTPSEVIPGGFKGLGEGGILPGPATIGNAVAAAVPEIAGALTETPLTPFRIWSALNPPECTEAPPGPPRQPATGIGGPMSLSTLTNFIDGKAAEPSSAAHYEVIDPCTGVAYARAPLSRGNDVDLAMRAADAAFGTWRRTTPAERQLALLGMADALLRRRAEFAAAETHGTGSGAASDEIPLLADQLRFFAGAARVLDGASAGEYVADHTSYVRREPVGVCAQLAPWNFPLLMAVLKCAPAIAAGNTVVLKPADTTPVSALMFAELAAEFLPPGVLNVICGGAETGRHMVEHPIPAIVSLTGSVAAGIDVARVAAASLKRVHLELGGNTPVLVCPDADLAQAVPTIIKGAFSNAGQDCTAAARVLVAAEIYDEVIAQLTKAAQSCRTGPPSDPDTYYGPLNNHAQLDRLTRLVDGVGPHARIMTGGRRVGGAGYFFAPTVIADVRQDDEITQSEIFGPVITVQPYRTEEEAVRLANAVPHGLASAVWTTDNSRAMRLSSLLDFGTVWVNTHLGFPSEMPHGGFKRSGYGKDLSLYGLHEYTRIKHVMHSFTAAPAMAHP
jgi:aerobic carbon-monoxide dehydrogenase large subunit